MSDKNWEDTMHDLLNRMKRNHKKGIGIRLSAEELRALGHSGLGELWEMEDPRKKTTENWKRRNDERQ